MTTGWKRLALLAGGFLIGTYGTKALGSKAMKKAYTGVTAGALRLKDEIVKDVTTITENCGDIAADARAMNEKWQEEEAAQKLQDAKDLIANAAPKRASGAKEK